MTRPPLPATLQAQPLPTQLHKACRLTPLCHSPGYIVPKHTYTLAQCPHCFGQPTFALTPIILLPEVLPSSFSSPAKPALRRACMSPRTHKHPKTSACPQANVWVPPTAPRPLLPAHSAVIPNSASHFLRAVSDKFIKLRDDTVNGHIFF